MLDLGVVFENPSVLIMIEIPFGLGASYIFYYVLKGKLKNEIVIKKDEIQYIGQNF